MKAYDLLKNNFQFNETGIESEFKEYIDYVFKSKNTLFFVFKKGFSKTKNPKLHIKESFKESGCKIKFLKQ